jgi:hypothetical protein
MTKQIMDESVLPQFIAHKLGTTKVIVQDNNSILTIEPLSSEKSDFTSHSVGVDLSLNSNSVNETRAGTLTLDDFTEIQISTKGFKFNREEANER